MLRDKIAFALATGALGLAAPVIAQPAATTTTTTTTTTPTLADQIVVVAKQIPQGAGSQQYEAQFAALFDRTGATCTQVRDAANSAFDLPRPAYIALQRVNRSINACSGTAAIGGGRANDLGSPGFAVGGGSDYVR